MSESEGCLFLDTNHFETIGEYFAGVLLVRCRIVFRHCLQCGKQLPQNRFHRICYQCQPHPPCSWPECPNTARSKGLCSTHYEWTRPKIPCTEQPCPNHAHARGLCRKHYMRRYRKGEYQCPE